MTRGLQALGNFGEQLWRYLTEFMYPSEVLAVFFHVLPHRRWPPVALLSMWDMLIDRILRFRCLFTARFVSDATCRTSCVDQCLAHLTQLGSRWCVAGRLLAWSALPVG